MSIIAAYIVPHPPLIIPDVGRGQQKKIQNTVDAYDRIAEQISEIKPETIVVITPHSIMYQDYIHISPGKNASGDLQQFGDFNTSVDVEYDTELVGKIEDLAVQSGVSAGTLGERNKNIDHGALVPLYFIRKYYSDFRAVRISISGLTYSEHYSFGMILREAIKMTGRRTVLIASGDLSHRLKEEGPYSFAEEGPIFDKQVTEAMKTADFMTFLNFSEEFCEAAGECGLRSFIIMAGALDGKAIEPEFHSYEGPFGVGYAVCGFRITGEDSSRQFNRIYNEEHKKRLTHLKENEDEYVRLARLSLESYVRDKKYIQKPDKLPDELINRKAGVFVSLKKDGRLRGCIGTISPVEKSVADEIIRNAVSAGVGDPRFEPVTPDELPELVYSVDVLGEPEPIESESELDVIRYGVIVTKGRKRGLLLPNLEGVNTPKQQVEIALQKAGIHQSESYQMERFEVVRHK